MKEHMPQEIEVWFVLPALRREFAKLMVKKGMSQKEAAKRLGVTESAVSQYLKEKRARQVIAFDQDIKKEIGKSVDKVLEGDSLVREMQRICDIARKKRLVCRISKKMGYAPKCCCECFE